MSPGAETRSDLGYGRTSDKYQKSRSRGGSFPYPDPDQINSEDIDVELSPEDIAGIIKKVPGMAYLASDPNDDASTDHFYFAAGNTKLSDCFYRTDSVLLEVEVASRSMSPVPGMYRDKNVLFGTQDGPAMYIKDHPMKRTGSLKGWSKAPETIIDVEDEDHPNTLQDLIDLMLSEEM
tara:strand:- start:59 stop:592 length:534 start_codon:yes stop_codon:yes gene_type:complete